MIVKVYYNLKEKVWKEERIIFSLFELIKDNIFRYNGFLGIIEQSFYYLY